MLEYIFDGGMMMLPLVFLSVIAFAVIIDRALAFKAAEKDTRGLRQKVRDSLEEGKIDEAINECQTCGGPVAAILMVGLVKFRKLLERGKTLTEIEVNVNKTMNDYSPHVIDTLEKRIGLLPVIASISPLLGMTGTVTGMISSFDAMSKSSALEATAVSSGISEALITTAAGLLIAMPAVIAYNIFSKRVDRFILEIEESSTELIDHITLDYEIEK